MTNTYERVTIPRLVVGGVTSGVGKTTVAAGLIAAFRRRGLRVQPFKCGPDYIDPSHLSRAAGVPARNLDSWMLSHEVVQELFARGCRNADIAVVEGMMGLFDGRSGEGEAASTAEIAHILKAPVLLVMDVGKVARSAAATALGFQMFDPKLKLVGVVLNQIGSARHREMIEAPIASLGLKVFGALPKRDEIALPERHLGLVPDAEGGMTPEHLERLSLAIEEGFDLDSVLRAAREAPAFEAPDTGLFPGGRENSMIVRRYKTAPPTRQEPRRQVGKPRIAVAQDKAFSFYYQENLELLAAYAEVVPFSPLAGDTLPEKTMALYIGGGFPEMYAAELSANARMRNDIRAAVGYGMPVLGECGGLMYLCQSIVDLEGVRHEMVGAVPGACVMERRRVGLGYLTLKARTDTLLLNAGDTVRAHEFHWSRLEQPVAERDAAFEIEEHLGRLEGIAQGNVLASYAHLHFAARRELAPRFMTEALQWAMSATALP